MVHLALAEAELVPEVIDCLVPHSWRPLESVQRALELAHMIRILGIDESVRLLPIHFFVKHSVEERCLDIHQVDNQLVLRRDAQDDPD